MKNCKQLTGRRTEAKSELSGNFRLIESLAKDSKPIANGLMTFYRM